MFFFKLKRVLIRNNRDCGTETATKARSLSIASEFGGIPATEPETYRDDFAMSNLCLFAELSKNCLKFIFLCLFMGWNCSAVSVLPLFVSHVDLREPCHIDLLDLRELLPGL